jgi:ubiquinone/menaquinone biosynthesis C-methylase UbiE
MSQASGPDAAVTNRTLLAEDAYADDRHVSARQRLYEWQRPRYDLPAMVLDRISGQRGVLVDVGCGNGRYLRRLREARPDLTVIGLDISAGIVAGLPAPVIVADGMRLPLPDSSTSVALAMHMIYHLSDIEAGLRELARVLGPGGLLIASTNAS